MNQRNPRWEKFKEVRKAKQNSEAIQRARISYLEQREAYNNSQQAKLQESVRNSVQKVSKAEDDAYNIIFQAVKNLREETVELIKSVVIEEKEEMGFISPAMMEYALNKTDIAINKIKQVCELAEYQKRLTKGNYDDYEKLFNTLMDEVDVGFAIFAPIKSVARKRIKYSKLQEEVKDYVFERFAVLGLTENEEFMKYYYSAFENQVLSTNCVDNEI